MAAKPTPRSARRCWKICRRGGSGLVGSRFSCGGMRISVIICIGSRAFNPFCRRGRQTRSVPPRPIPSGAPGRTVKARALLQQAHHAAFHIFPYVVSLLGRRDFSCYSPGKPAKRLALISTIMTVGTRHPEARAIPEDLDREKMRPCGAAWSCRVTVEIAL